MSSTSSATPSPAPTASPVPPASSAPATAVDVGDKLISDLIDTTKRSKEKVMRDLNILGLDSRVHKLGHIVLTAPPSQRLSTGASMKVIQNAQKARNNTRHTKAAITLTEYFGLYFVKHREFPGLSNFSISTDGLSRKATIRLSVEDILVLTSYVTDMHSPHDMLDEEKLPEAAPDAVPDAVPEAVPDAVPEAAPDTRPAFFRGEYSEALTLGNGQDALEKLM